jgi:predicted GNAT family acetyltransferase
MDWKFEKGRVFSTNENGELMAEATYSIKENGEADINHSYVNPVLRGQGIAGKLMEALALHLRKNHIKATATCSFANSWLTKNKALYNDIISDDFCNEIIACKISN